MDLFLDADEVGLGTCVAFPARVHLLAQHPKSAFFVFALLSDVVEAFTAFSQVGLKLRLLQGQFFDHGLKFRTALRLADGFGQLSSPFADLMLEFVHSSHQSFSARFRLLPLRTGLSEVNLHRVELRMGVFEGGGVLLTGLGGFASHDLGGVFLLLKGLDLRLQDSVLLVRGVQGLLGSLQFTAQARIHGTDGLITHHGEGLCNISAAGHETQFSPFGPQRFQTGFEAQQVVQHGLQGGLARLRAGSDGGQGLNEAGQREFLNRARIGGHDGAGWETDELHFSLGFRQGQHRRFMRVHRRGPKRDGNPS